MNRPLKIYSKHTLLCCISGNVRETFLHRSDLCYFNTTQQFQCNLTNWNNIVEYNGNFQTLISKNKEYQIFCVKPVLGKFPCGIIIINDQVHHLWKITFLQLFFIWGFWTCLSVFIQISWNVKWFIHKTQFEVLPILSLIVWILPVWLREVMCHHRHVDSD